MFVTVLSSVMIVTGVFYIVLEQAAGLGVFGKEVTPDLERTETAICRSSSGWNGKLRRRGNLRQHMTVQFGWRGRQND